MMDVFDIVEFVAKVVFVEVGIYLYCRIVHNSDHLDLIVLLAFSNFP